MEKQRTKSTTKSREKVMTRLYPKGLRLLKISLDRKVQDEETIQQVVRCPAAQKQTRRYLKRRTISTRWTQKGSSFYIKRGTEDERRRWSASQSQRHRMDDRIEKEVKVIKDVQFWNVLRRPIDKMVLYSTFLLNVRRHGTGEVKNYKRDL